ncbi:MAG: zinc ribbon domain-containing protein [Deltaproteobacteria bacterium]|nr:zinc ribbon domain-containing protein [Deltaproteobacteria bacterium]MBW1932080.1 zinc ribbon domain-containing protein [Deltaproteobacteria bacterium]MBW1938917.1 zinc ribbon domain-containing protein [Deltaproteobacteria bacterium]MBW2079380.1 zinc ribbon domain-containing protein [Deltaproteobacteria bacterium]
MPIYEYTCKKCNKIFESLVLSSRDIKEIQCPECGSEDVHKMLSSFSSGSTGPVSGGLSGESSCSSSRFE